MIKKFTLSLFALVSAFCGYTQVYTQGDVTVTIAPAAIHDSTNCASISQLMYSIEIQNSFMGDSVKVIDPSWGAVMYAEGNSTGQSPWIVMVPFFQGQMVSDLDMSGGTVFFFNPDTKVVSGPDTVYNIVSSFPYVVPNPCQISQCSGRIYADNNGNCSYDAGDQALVGLIPNTQPVYNTPTYILSGASSYASNANGIYSSNVISSWLTSVQVSMPSNYQFMFPPSACSPLVYQFTSLPQNTADFALQCNNNLDVQVLAGGPPFVRPLVPFFLNTGVSNMGCTSVNGTLSVVIDPNVTYNAGLSSNPASSVSGDTLIWNYFNLTSLSSPGYWNAFFSGVHLTPSNNLNIGDSVCFEIFTAAPANDIDASNNYASFCIHVVNSFDPNIKEVSPKGEGAQGFIPASTPELTYTVHFQNTGNAAAYNVTVIDTLDNDLQASALQIVGASHTMTPEWKAANVVAFHFYGINLPDSATNEAASHGLVKFKIKPQGNLAAGTQITNKASIYFDNNAPIVTNTALNTIAAPNSIKEETAVLGVNVYPNPNSGTVTISFNEEAHEANIKVMSLDGKMVLEQNNISGKQLAIDISEHVAGVYFVELSNKGKTARAKLIKNR